METYTAPPQFDKRTWEIVGPQVLDTNEVVRRLSFALTGSDDPDVSLTCEFHPNNGVLIAGGAAAGKSSLARTLEESGGPDLAHTPTDKLFRKDYGVDINPAWRGEDPMFFESQTIAEYVHARVEGIIEMIHTIKRLRSEQQYDGDQIIIGGAMQSLISLFVYCNLCYQPGHEYRLPEEVMKIMVLLFQQWSPSTMVYVDARKEVREERARQQDIYEPGSLQKRELAFAFDHELREVTLHTMRLLVQIARQNGTHIPIFFLSTDTEEQPTPAGFFMASDAHQLQGFIGQRLKHTERDYVWARSVEYTWDD
jgi:hypothetical protein